ncbi:MAG TPA: ABC transporter ATP-binding protein [Solirubrobacteraceae bacterium]|nr:ABC transporter ATP-binding protein [Solirubrobacteraceae bacterium]
MSVASTSSGRTEADGGTLAPLDISARERLSALLGKRHGKVIGLAISSIVSGFAEAGILILLAQAAQAIAKGSEHVHLKLWLIHGNASIGTLFVAAGCLGFARLALQAPLSILPALIAADVQSRMRTNLFHAFTRASWEVQSRDREGHLQETMTSQVIQATGGALQATTFVTSLFTFLVLMISALTLNLIAAGVVLATAIALFAVLRPLNRLGVRRARALSAAQMEYAGGIGEAIRVAEETHVFGVDGAQRERIDGFVATSKALFFRSQLIGRLTPNLYQSTMYLLLIGGLAIIHATSAGHLASLGGVVLLLVRAGTNGQQVQGSFQALRQSLPFIERLQEAARRYEESSPVRGEEPLQRVETVVFEDVSFAYRRGRPVLSHVSFEVLGGETVGVIGPSGAGKSTLVQVALRLRLPTGGRYLVNGLDADSIRSEDWHRLVAYVPQEPRLLHASVAENIKYFRDIDDAGVERAARLARIHDDILAWPDGYATVIGPRADAVSGGQQQRICLARALAARPEVLVLDEPTSALDPHSERLIQESLTELKHELTLLVVAHRMSTLDICDRVMVIIDGRLAAFDTRALLARENQYYRSASMLAAGAPDGQLR